MALILPADLKVRTRQLPEGTYPATMLADVGLEKSAPKQTQTAAVIGVSQRIDLGRKMKTILKSLVLIIGISLVAPVIPIASANNLGRCMSDALNGKERKELAKWIFFSIAAHPEISSYLKATTKDIDDSNRKIGKLITRLLTSDCPNELKSAVKFDPLALRKSFGVVGRVAIQELMTDKNVTRAISGYVQYTDKKKIAALILAK